ncbi:asparagine-linked glycosylation protein [Thecaphora frezii]
MDQLLTAQSLTSLGYVGAMAAGAYSVANRYLPATASTKSRFIFIWLAFDAICHLTLEGSFLYLSTQGRSVNSSAGFFALTWQEYTKADSRWGVSEPNVVAIEWLTVLGAGPLAAYICYQMTVDDPSYHYWIVILSTAEIYGGFMTFAPEWLSGSRALDTSNWLYTWVYLAFMNLVWVFIPLWLLYDSYLIVARTLRSAGTRPIAEAQKPQGSNQRQIQTARPARVLGFGAYLVIFTALFFSVLPSSANAAEVARHGDASGARASSPSTATSLWEVLLPIVLPLFLLTISISVGAVQVAESSIRKVKRSSGGRRRKLLQELSIDEKSELSQGKQRRTILGLFHPYCNAGGGGERVLFEVIAYHQRNDPDMVIAIYTGDYPAASKGEILGKAKQRFGIEVKEDNVILIPLRNRHLVEDGYWRRLTLLGQSYGSVVMAFEAMGALIPDVFIDTMGYAFAYPVVRVFSKKAAIGAYVHYPTISTDMLRRVEKREAGHTNDAKVAQSIIRSKAKLYYYRIFAWLYSLALRRADRLVVNGTWTRDHINSLLGAHRDVSKRAEIVYPPCDTRSMASFSLEGRKRWVVSLAQFRPEKEHPQQLRVLRALLDARPGLFQGPDPVRLVMMGSSRNVEDEKRIEALRQLIGELGLRDHVDIVVNAAWSVVLENLQQASVGLSTMVDEHFGINVVEFMAAGLITLSHASAGPLMDIAVPVDGQRTGYHATSVSSFASALGEIFDLSSADALAIRAQARSRATSTFGAEGFCQSWRDSLWAPLVVRLRGPAQDGETRKTQ